MGGTTQDQNAVELCMTKIKGSYRKGLQIIYGIQKSGIHPKDNSKIKDFIKEFETKDD